MGRILNRDKARQAEEDDALRRGEEPPSITVDVDPQELPEFQEAARRLSKARAYADQLPAEATPENKGQFADVLKSLRDADRDAEDARKKLTRKFDDGKKRVKGQFDELRSSVSAAKESVADRLLVLEAAERKADEEERAAERAAAEAEQKRENERAEAEGRRSKHVPPPAPRVRPTGARGPSGAKASPVKETKYNIVDEAAIPDEYWRKELNRAKLQTDVRAGVVIPGVEPYVEESMRVG